ncbi:unnamed protein product [Cyclocybe aegerita]|uniref:Uncharacterized protein n=1 Tax=Cyclocybe aegerita TaxID=1973307 RepID=A0A8S0WBK5_CYCAE|nr:unnamed protein product [Cyclocybe aegerita]
MAGLEEQQISAKPGWLALARVKNLGSAIPSPLPSKPEAIMEVKEDGSQTFRQADVFVLPFSIRVLSTLPIRFNSTLVVAASSSSCPIIPKGIIHTDDQLEDALLAPPSAPAPVPTPLGSASNKRRGHLCFCCIFLSAYQIGSSDMDIVDNVDVFDARKQDLQASPFFRFPPFCTTRQILTALLLPRPVLSSQKISMSSPDTPSLTCSPSSTNSAGDCTIQMTPLEDSGFPACPSSHSWLNVTLAASTASSSCSSLTLAPEQHYGLLEAPSVRTASPTLMMTPLPFVVTHQNTTRPSGRRTSLALRAGSPSIWPWQRRGLQKVWMTQ